MNNGNLKLSVEDLVNVTDLGLIHIRRDQEIMATYGVTAKAIDDLEADNELLKVTPTDEELQSELSEKTRSKNETAELLREPIRSIKVRAIKAFGSNSPEVKGFGAANLSQLSDNGLIRAGRSVLRMCKKKFDKLTVKGLTQQMLDDLGVLIKKFDALIDDVAEAEETHREATALRNQLATKVYNALIEMFDYGKDYWKGKDEIKYQEYVMFGSNAKPKTGKGTIHGNVSSSTSGNPVSGALVSVAGTELQTTTNEEGNYQIPDVPIATYTVKCTFAGMQPAEKPNTLVKDGEDTGCDFELSPV